MLVVHLKRIFMKQSIQLKYLQTENLFFLTSLEKIAKKVKNFIFDRCKYFPLWDLHEN